ncbi:hypothetical protein BT96DRAFT_481037 [Gymnopus androsaceus JB14]|uniref:Uncharacterized protein n=1 Tax=Gymnopus androsaceus JB14 TaxID=1447944 RepID=A0A6A4HYM1_9AGAR|nr:hypothetical protein BT96DRAFT_481037 [Gymnopus androsaceus JB14]
MCIYALKLLVRHYFLSATTRSSQQRSLPHQFTPFTPPDTSTSHHLGTRRINPNSFLSLNSNLHHLLFTNSVNITDIYPDSKSPRSPWHSTMHNAKALSSSTHKREHITHCDKHGLEPSYQTNLASTRIPTSKSKENKYALFCFNVSSGPDSSGENSTFEPRVGDELGLGIPSGLRWGAKCQAEMLSSLSIPVTVYFCAKRHYT